MNTIAGLAIGASFALVVSGHTVAAVAIFTLAYLLLRGTK